MRRAGSLYLILIGLLFCAAGGVFTWLMWRSYERASAQRDWLKTDCTILESRVEERKIGDEVPAEYRFAVLYGYEAEGTAHTSDRYDLRGSAWTQARERVEKLVDDHQTGSRRTCYLDPANPESAVLHRDSKAPGYSLWFPLLIVAGGIGIIVGGVRGLWRRG